MTWVVQVECTTRFLTWTFVARTAAEFRDALNTLGNENGVSFGEVVAVQFRRQA